MGHSDYHWAHEPCFYASKAGSKPAFYGDRSQSTIWRASMAQSKAVSTVVGPGVVLLDGAGGSLYITQRPPKGKKARQVRIAEAQTAFLQSEGGPNTVWEVARDFNYVHPTQKPVELARRAMENSSRPGEVVLDLFGGSGSTLIAAESTGRQARIMELDPAYADVIVARWEGFTGKKANRQ